MIIYNLVFLGTKAILCDFHREQAWERWLAKKANGCSQRKGDILPFLRRIARSRTIDEMNDAISNLEKSEFFDENFKTFREYIEKYWLSIKEVQL